MSPLHSLKPTGGSHDASISSSDAALVALTVVTSCPFLSTRTSMPAAMGAAGCWCSAPAQQLRRCGLLVLCARSAAEPRALRPAATDCWCPVPAPPPSGRPPSPPQPRPTCPPRSGLTRGNADSAATTPRSNTPLFLTGCNAGSKGLVLLLTRWRPPFAAPYMQVPPVAPPPWRWYRFFFSKILPSGVMCVVWLLCRKSL